MDRLGEANFLRTERLCRRLDRSLDGAGIDGPPTAGHFLFLKTLVDALSLSALVLRRIMAEERPSKVGIAPTAPEAFIPSSLYFRTESIHARVLPLLADGAGIPVEGIAVPAMSPPDIAAPAAGSLLSRLRALADTFAGPLDLPLAVARQSLLAHPGGSVLVLDRSLVPPVLAVPRTRLLFWSPESGAISSLDLSRGHGPSADVTEAADRAAADARARAAKAWDLVQTDEEVAAAFSAEGTDLAPLAWTRLKVFLDVVVPEAVAAGVLARSWFPRAGVRAVVAAGYGDLRRAAVARAAREMGILALTVQHGAYGYFHWPIIGYTDGAPASHWLVGGEGVRSHCDVLCSGPRVEVVGSPKLGDLARRLSRTSPAAARRRLGLGPGPVWAYYVTNLMGRARYLAGHTTTDHRHYVVQRKVLEVFRDAPEAQLVLKLHPTREHPESPIAEDVADLAMSRILAVKDAPSWEVLAAADAFVIDSPTTSFLEMLLTGKPVVAFNDFFRWEPGAVTSFPPQVAFERDLEAFLQRLAKAVSEPVSPPVPPGGEFLRLYGTHDSRKNGLATWLDAHLRPPRVANPTPSQPSKRVRTL